MRKRIHGDGARRLPVTVKLTAAAVAAIDATGRKRSEYVREAVREKQEREQ